MKIILLYKKYTSFFWYGAFVLAIFLWIGFEDLTKYDRMLQQSPEIRIYLNGDGSFKEEKYKKLEQKKKDKFWNHQLEQVEKQLTRNKNSIDFDYELITRKTRQQRDQQTYETYLEAMKSARSDIEKISLNNGYQVSRAESRARDLKADNDYYLHKLVTQKEIKDLETLRDLINSRLMSQ